MSRFQVVRWPAPGGGSALLPGAVPGGVPAVRSRVVHAAISPTGRFVATASPVDGVRIYSYGAGGVTQVDALPLWDCAQVAFVEEGAVSRQYATQAPMSP